MNKTLQLTVLLFPLLYGCVNNCNNDSTDIKTKACTTYYENGKIFSIENYWGEVLSGNSKYYYPNQKLKLEKEFINGKEHGQATEYYEGGSIYKESIYKAGKVLYLKIYSLEKEVKDEFRRLQIYNFKDTVKSGERVSIKYRLLPYDGSCDTVLYSMKKPKLFIEGEIALQKSFEEVPFSDTIANIEFNLYECGEYGMVISMLELRKDSVKRFYEHPLRFVVDSSHSSKSANIDGLLKQIQLIPR